ncbi:MAG: hypothetical protein KJ597_04745 [Nanoarchaeota archaeon]|nr:hypothetical protein [Nanoarchaeota archaeon]MBU1622854.1 hypothetical protein [Nanoarchaeota archaeon]
MAHAIMFDYSPNADSSRVRRYELIISEKNIRNIERDARNVAELGENIIRVGYKEINCTPDEYTNNLKLAFDGISLISNNGDRNLIFPLFEMRRNAEVLLEEECYIRD